MLSEHGDLTAAKRFFRSAKTVSGVIPDRVTTDGHDAYPQAIRTELGSRVRHRTNCYLNNRLEQDHRGVKGRCRPMLASRVSHQQDDIAAATTNSGTSFALDLACANTFPPLHGAFSICVGQPSCSISWKLLEREAPQPKNAA